MNDRVFKGPPIVLKKPTEPFGLHVLKRMKVHGSKVAQIDPETGHELTYATLRDRCIAFAYDLQQRGLKLGDKLMIMTENGLDAMIPYISALCVGVCVTPLHQRETADNILTMFVNLKPKVIVCQTVKLAFLQNVAKQSNVDVEFIVFEEEFQEIVKNGRNTIECLSVDERFDAHKDLAVVACSSGTTGVSKGITITHEALHYLVVLVDNLVHEDEIVFQFTSIFWISSTFINFSCIEKGATLIWGSDPIKSIEEILETIQRFKVNWAFIQPPFLREMVRRIKPSEYNLSSLSYVVTGGTPSTREELKTYRKFFKGVFMANIYALTEVLTTVGLYNRKTDAELSVKKFDSAGPITAGIQVKILDTKNGQPLPRNVQGEICVLSPSCTRGYYNLPDKTKEAIDEDGWFHTGDLGYVDDDNFIYVAGRKNDVLTYRGELVNLPAIDSILARHPAVQRSATLGVIKCDDQVPYAFVVVKSGASISKEDIESHVKEHGTDGQQLRGGVQFVDTIQTTPSGKLKKMYLKKLLPSDVLSLY